jgi:hypothetical protein
LPPDNAETDAAKVILSDVVRIALITSGVKALDVGHARPVGTLL